MPKPSKLVVDVTSSLCPGMVYVMLSRVQCLDQICILDKFDPEKIVVDADVRTEVARMNKVSVNQNPSEWMDSSQAALRISSLNCRSLRKHINDVKSDNLLLRGDFLCLQETWLEEGEEKQGNFELQGFRGIFKSMGRGKGIALYVREGIQLELVQVLGRPNVQIIKLTMENLDLMNIYRSQDEPLSDARDLVLSYIDPEKDTLIVGDLNVCASQSNQFTNSLQRAGFTQLVAVPTHIQGGKYQHLDFLPIPLFISLSGALDHVYLRRCDNLAKLNSQARYYTDHNLITVFLPS